MSVATSTAIAIGAGVSAAGAVGGAAMSANAAGNAASTQSNAAKDAAQLSYQAQQQALQFQEGVYNNNLSLQSPYYSAGVSGLTNLENLLGILPASAATTAIPQPRPINVPGLPNPSGGPAQPFNPASIPNGPRPGNPAMGNNARPGMPGSTLSPASIGQVNAGGPQNELRIRRISGLTNRTAIFCAVHQTGKWCEVRCTKSRRGYCRKQKKKPQGHAHPNHHRKSAAEAPRQWMMREKRRGRVISADLRQRKTPKCGPGTQKSKAERTQEAGKC